MPSNDDNTETVTICIDVRARVNVPRMASVDDMVCAAHEILDGCSYRGVDFDQVDDDNNLTILTDDGEYEDADEYEDACKEANHAA